MSDDPLVFPADPVASGDSLRAAVEVPAVEVPAVEVPAGEVPAGAGAHEPSAAGGAGAAAWYGGLSRRTRIALWSLLVVWLALGLALFGGWEGLRDRIGRSAPPVPRRADLALLVIGGDGDPPSPPAMALLHRDGTDADVVLLPAGTLVEVPGRGPRSLAAALDEGGPDVLAISVANALGVRIPVLLVAGPADARRLIDEMRGVEVAVPETIEVEESGFQKTLFTRGTTHMNGEEFVRFLTLAVPGQTELERVARQNAAWRALFTKLAGLPCVTEGGRRTCLKDGEAAVARDLAGWGGRLEGAQAYELLHGLARTDAPAYTTLPVERVGVSQADLYEIQRDDLDVLRSSLGDVTSYRSRDGVRIRLLIGASGPVAEPVARKLVEEGFAIVLSGVASQQYERTTVVMAENTDRLRRRAERIVALLGTGTVGLSKAPQTLVDVTVVVGRDWAQANGFPQPPPTPTPRSTPRKRREEPDRV